MLRETSKLITLFLHFNMVLLVSVEIWCPAKKAVCGKTPPVMRDVTPLVRLDVLGLFERNFGASLNIAFQLPKPRNLPVAVFQTCLACLSQTHSQKENSFKTTNGATGNLAVTLTIFIIVRFCTKIINLFLS